MTRTTLKSIEYAHKTKLLSKVIVRKGGQKLLRSAPKSVSKLP
jgi:hypothetical protein